MKIVILSFYFGRHPRGVESWAVNLQRHLKDVVVSTGGRLEALLCRLFTWIAKRPMVVFGHSGPGADDKWNLWCSPDVFVAFSRPQAEWAGRFGLS